MAPADLWKGEVLTPRDFADREIRHWRNPDDRHKNFIMHAIDRGSFTVFQYLMDQEDVGADELGYSDDDGNTLLHHIAKLPSGRGSFLKYLETYDRRGLIKVNSVNHKHETVLFIAARDSKPNVIDFLISTDKLVVNEAERERLGKMELAPKVHRRLLRYLVGDQEPVRKKMKFEGYDPAQERRQLLNDLVEAIGSGLTYMVDRVLMTGDLETLKADSIAENGQTPMTAPILSQNLNMLKYMVDHFGRDSLKSTDGTGDSLLMVAIDSKKPNKKIVSYLLSQKETDPFYENNGMTALELAALKSNDGLISMWADNHPTMLEPIDKTLRMLKKKGHMLTEINTLRRARIIDILETELQSRMNRGEISTSTPIRPSGFHLPRIDTLKGHRKTLFNSSDEEFPDQAQDKNDIGEWTTQEDYDDASSTDDETEEEKTARVEMVDKRLRMEREKAEENHRRIMRERKPQKPEILNFDDVVGEDPDFPNQAQSHHYEDDDESTQEGESMEEREERDRERQERYLKSQNENYDSGISTLELPSLDE